jgi:hypothetical protein
MVDQWNHAYIPCDVIEGCMYEWISAADERTAEILSAVRDELLQDNDIFNGDVLYLANVDFYTVLNERNLCIHPGEC